MIMLPKIAEEKGLGEIEVVVALIDTIHEQLMVVFLYHTRTDAFKSFFFICRSTSVPLSHANASLPSLQQSPATCSG